MITNSYLVGHSKQWENNEDRESDLTECLLSEGTTAQIPLIVYSLETNMKNIQLSKNKSISKDKSMKNMIKDNMVLNSKYSQRKSCSISPVHFLYSENSDLMKAKDFNIRNTNDVSPKITTSWQSPQTLKDEIRGMLRKLAKDRLLNSKWNEEIVLMNNTEDKKQLKLASEVKDAPLSQKIDRSSIKTSKMSANVIPTSPEDISMWHIHPNWNIDSLFD